MRETTPAAVAAAERRSLPDWITMAGLAFVSGGMIAWLGRFGPIPQTAIVLGVSLGVPMLLLFLARPYVALAAYLFVLPLIVPVPVAAGLNAGEVLTFLIMLLGATTLWGARERLAYSLARLRPILLPLAALSAVSLISLLVNEIFRFVEIASALFKILAFALIPILVHVHVRSVGQARFALLGLLLGGAAVAVYSIVAYAAGWSYSEQYDWNRPMGTFENWNLLGACMALVSLPTLGFATTAAGGRRMLLVLLFALEIVVLLLSLTLGSVLGLAGGTVIVLFLMRPRWSRILPILLLALLTAGAVFATTPLLRHKVTQVDERVLDRLRTYATGAMMFRDRFWWGFGSEQNMAAELIGGEADYAITRFGVSMFVPHNAFLKVSAEKGVFGLIAFTALIVGSIIVLVRSRRHLRRPSEAALYYGILAGMFAFLLQNMTNDLLQHARLGILFFALLAIADRLAPTPDAA